jgi:sugar lactone lactonase YvrE
MKRIIILILILGTLSACSAAKVPDEIIFDFDNLYPDGIEYDENEDHFLLGSRSERTIFQVFEDGTIEPFIEDPDLMECAGLEIDRKNQRLLVVSNDEGESKSYLNSYDLNSGERIFLSDISSIKPDRIPYAIDIAVDADGNAYVTDNGSWLNAEATPAIYRVDLEGNPTLFMEHPLFDYIRGIVYHPDGFLLLGSAPGLLLKIPLDNPEVITVDITDGDWGFEETDSMLMHPDGTLIMLTYPDKKVGRLKSDDNWETAQAAGISSEHKDGSTIALRGEEVYIIYSYGDFGGLGKQITFKIVRVIFE